MSHSTPDTLRARHLFAYYAGRKIPGKNELDALTGQASLFARASTDAAVDALGNSYTAPAQTPVYVYEDGVALLLVDEDNPHAWEFSAPLAIVGDLVVLLEYVERGRVTDAGQILLRVHDATVDALTVESTGSAWKLTHSNGVTTRFSAVTTTPAVGQRVQLQIDATASGRVRLRQRLMVDGEWTEWESGLTTTAIAPATLAVETSKLSLWDEDLDGETNLAMLLAFEALDPLPPPPPPDAVDLAVEWFLARANRTLTFHARSECRRIEFDEESVVAQTVETVPDLGLNGRYFKQATAGDRTKLVNDGTRAVMRGALDWMGIFESNDAQSTQANLFNATTGAVAFVMSSVPVGNQFANPVIGSASYHLFFDAGASGSVGSQYGGTVVAVDYAVGTMIAGVYRRGANRKFGTDAEAEVSGAGADITAQLSQVVELFRRNADTVVIPNIDLAFIHTEDGDVSDGDLVTMMTHLATIKE